jgi:DNA-directed RNA polymerase subunit M/transcription elongation factor TFIIS
MKRERIKHKQLVLTWGGWMEQTDTRTCPKCGQFKASYDHLCDECQNALYAHAAECNCKKCQEQRRRV